MNREVAVFGGGCFWCTEAVFQRLAGVLKVQPGYAGGIRQNPTYEQVCTGSTGHAEVIRVIFDPTIISYPTLLEVFFASHDPTTLNQQGADVGTQYRSIILTTSEAQAEKSRRYIEMLEKSGTYRSPIVTEITSLTTFYPAEAYHQDYYNNHQTDRYCRLVIDPKLRKLFSMGSSYTSPSEMKDK